MENVLPKTIEAFKRGQAQSALARALRDAPPVSFKTPRALPSLDPDKIYHIPPHKAPKTSFVAINKPSFSLATILTKRAANELMAEVIEFKPRGKPH